MCRKILFILILLIPVKLLAQGEENIEYGREFIYGVNKSTFSGLIGGFVFRYSTAITPRTFHTFSVDFLNIKHPKEYKESFNSNASPFIAKKLNYLFAVRTTYGRDWTLFKKAPQQGVQINGILTGGPVFGLVSPYYIQTATSTNGRAVYEPYDPKKHTTSSILGPGGFFQGLGESKINLGLSIKAGLSFEFGTYKSNLAGFETGFAIDAFTSKVPIMYEFENRAVYPSAYINLFWGSRK